MIHLKVSFDHFENGKVGVYHNSEFKRVEPADSDAVKQMCTAINTILNKYEPEER